MLRLSVSKMDSMEVDLPLTSAADAEGTTIFRVGKDKSYE
jgi:hypothetical protein